MSKLKHARLMPETQRGVVCDLSGGLQESFRCKDPENMSAVASYLVRAMCECGSTMGMTNCEKISIAGPGYAASVFSDEKNIWIFELEPNWSQREFEKKFESAQLSAVK